MCRHLERASQDGTTIAERLASRVLKRYTPEFSPTGKLNGSRKNPNVASPPLLRPTLVITPPPKVPPPGAGWPVLAMGVPPRDPNRKAPSPAPPTRLVKSAA